MAKKAAKKGVSRAIVLPTEKSIRAQTVEEHIIMVYGPPGIGKTKFAEDMSPRTLHLSTERGTRYLNALRLEISNYTEFKRTMKTLTNHHDLSSLYDMISVDHVDDLCMMVETRVCSRLGIDDLADVEWGKGFRQYRRAFWNEIAGLFSLPTGLILVAHETSTGLILVAHETSREIKTKLRKTDTMIPDLTKSSRKILLPRVDFVGYCTFAHLRIKGSKKRKEVRIVRSQPVSGIYAKDRTLRRKPKDGWEYLDGAAFAQTFIKKKGSKYHGKKVKKVIHKKRVDKRSKSVTRRSR
jgi:hypothetical protein